MTFKQDSLEYDMFEKYTDGRIAFNVTSYRQTSRDSGVNWLVCSTDGETVATSQTTAQL